MHSKRLCSSLKWPSRPANSSNSVARQPCQSPFAPPTARSTPRRTWFSNSGRFTVHADAVRADFLGESFAVIGERGFGGGVAFDDEVGVGQHGFQFAQNNFESRPTWRNKFRSSAKSFQPKHPSVQSKQNAPSSTKHSLATRNREIAIHTHICNKRFSGATAPRLGRVTCWAVQFENSRGGIRRSFLAAEPRKDSDDILKRTTWASRFFHRETSGQFLAQAYRPHEIQR